jgi:hypothetical protein
MTDAEFAAFLAESVEELTAKQGRLNTEHGLGKHKKWTFDATTRVLKFLDAEGKVAVEADTLEIGTFSRRAQTFRWAWANESVPAESRERALRLRELGAKTGKKAFDKEAFPADERKVRELAAMAVRHLGAEGAYFAPSGQLLVVLAIEKIRQVAH